MEHIPHGQRDQRRSLDQGLVGSFDQHVKVRFNQEEFNKSEWKLTFDDSINIPMELWRPTTREKLLPSWNQVCEAQATDLQFLQYSDACLPFIIQSIDSLSMSLHFLFCPFTHLCCNCSSVMPICTSGPPGVSLDQWVPK